MFNALLGFLEDGNKHHFVTTNPEFILEAQKNEEFKNTINSSDLSLIDGIGILVATEYAQRKIHSRNTLISIVHFLADYLKVGVCKQPVSYHGKHLERISGVDLVLMLVQQEWMRGRKIYLLGGMDIVSSLAMRRLQQINPDIQFRSSKGESHVKESLESFEQNKESSVVISDINTFNPDVLLVAYGHPWQDIWIARYKDKLNFKIAVGVGGTFDFLAGRVPRAPTWMRKIGLEWLYRMVKQPRRFNRIWSATWIFMRKIIASGTILS